MIILKNQTIYQCSYCSKRLLTKQGALIHENGYCKNKDSPNYRRRVLNPGVCSHDNIKTKWARITGEVVSEPHYDLCLDCGSIVE